MNVMHSKATHRKMYGTYNNSHMLTTLGVWDSENFKHFGSVAHHLTTLCVVPLHCIVGIYIIYFKLAIELLGNQLFEEQNPVHEVTTVISLSKHNSLLSHL